MVVTVTGKGELSVPASSASISYSLSAVDSSAQGAVNQVKQKIANINSVILDYGITQGDILESQITVSPDAITQRLFVASTAQGFKLTNVDTVNDLISSLYSSGAEVVSQPLLNAENQGDLEQEAFDLALKDAKTQAGKIALKQLKFIRKIVFVSQESSGTTSTIASKDTDLETGGVFGTTFKLSKQVSVSYKMW